MSGRRRAREDLPPRLPDEDETTYFRRLTDIARGATMLRSRHPVAGRERDLRRPEKADDESWERFWQRLAPRRRVRRRVQRPAAAAAAAADDGDGAAAAADDGAAAAADDGAAAAADDDDDGAAAAADDGDDGAAAAAADVVPRISIDEIRRTLEGGDRFFVRWGDEGTPIFDDLCRYLLSLPLEVARRRLGYFAHFVTLNDYLNDGLDPFTDGRRGAMEYRHKAYIMRHMNIGRASMGNYITGGVGGAVSYNIPFNNTVRGMGSPLFFLLQVIQGAIWHQLAARGVRGENRPMQVMIQLSLMHGGSIHAPPAATVQPILIDPNFHMCIFDIDHAITMLMTSDHLPFGFIIARASGERDEGDPSQIVMLTLLMDNAAASDGVGASECSDLCPLTYAAKFGTFIDIDTKGSCLFYAIVVGVAYLEQNKLLKKRRELDHFHSRHETLRLVRAKKYVKIDEVEEYISDAANIMDKRYVIHVYLMRPLERRYIGETLAISERGTMKPKLNICLFAHSDKPLWHAVYCTNEYAITSLEFDDLAKMPRYTACPRCRAIYNNQSQSRRGGPHVCQVDGVHSRWWCNRCRTVFQNEEDYNYHMDDNCFLKDVARPRIVQLPNPGDIATFDVDKHIGAIDDKDIIFADFEAVIDGVSGEHIPASVGYLYCGRINIHHGNDSVGWLIDNMIALADPKVYVFFHNGMGYDSHYIFTEALKKERGICVQGISKSSQQFLSIRLFKWVGHGTMKQRREVVFLDSLQFLPMSLAKLTQCALKSAHPIAEIFPTWTAAVKTFFTTEEEMRAACKKHLYPYYYFNIEEYEQQMDAPINDFAKIFKGGSRHFSLDEDVGQDACDEAVEFMRKYPSLFRVARDYHNFYLFCDIAQLSDMFMTVRAHYRRTHELELVSFVGLPSATWGSFMYKYGLGAQLPLLACPTMLALTRRMIRGGVSSAVKRLARTDDTHTLVYLDANSLYPHVMKDDFPCGNFELIPPPPVGEIMQWMQHELEYRGKGAIFEVDLAYPPDIGEYTKDYPFCPEHITTTREDYRDTYVEHLLRDHFLQRKMKFTGLGQTIRDKQKYAVYWKNLRWYLEHGLVLTCIHRVLRFDERPFMREYVELNTTLRRDGTSEFEKVFYKLLGNALYGKTFENRAKQSGVKIVQTKRVLTKLYRSNVIERLLYPAGDALVFTVYNDLVKLDKPSYIGAVVTELSKLHMYKFLYDVLYPRFGRENVQLCYTDTDSFVLEFTHPPGEGGIETITSRISDHMAIGSRSGETGYFKSETGVTPIKEFVCLRAKVYSMLLEGDDEITRAKGVSRAVHKELTHDLYRSMVMGERSPIYKVSMRNIRSRNHTIADERIVKVALSADDMKRIVCDDGIHTRPFS